MIFYCCSDSRPSTQARNLRFHTGSGRTVPGNHMPESGVQTGIRTADQLLWRQQPVPILTNPPNQPNNQTPRKFRIKGPDIIAIRKRFNLSQADFARLIEIDRATLNRWEHGKVRPNQSSMAKIAEFRTMGKKEFARRMAQVEEAIWK